MIIGVKLSKYTNFIYIKKKLKNEVYDKNNIKIIHYSFK